jgi:hypothetical protein
MTSTKASDLVPLMEAAARAGVNHQTLRRRINDGSLTAFRFGPRLLKVSLVEVEALFKPVSNASKL